MPVAFRLVPAKQQRDWTERWRMAGGKFHGDKRMIALKNSAVWSKLGDPVLFPDGLGNPYPPFAFSSGMDVRDVSREEAEELGVLAKGAPGPEPMDLGINDFGEIQAERFDRALTKAIEGDEELELVDGVLRLR